MLKEEKKINTYHNYTFPNISLSFKYSRISGKWQNLIQTLNPDKYSKSLIISLFSFIIILLTIFIFLFYYIIKDFEDFKTEEINTVKGLSAREFLVEEDYIVLFVF